MNILMFYTNSPMVGAGGPVYDIFRQFSAEGHEVRLLINSYEENEKFPEGIINMETWFRYKKKEWKRKIREKLGLAKKRKSDPDYHFQDIEEKKTYFSGRQLLKKAGMKPDIIIVFFVKNFINTKNVHDMYRLTGAPVYWVQYDMSAMTGGCHYAWDCPGYYNQCGKCPGLYSKDPHDITHQNLIFKKRYLEKTDIRVVVGTEWQRLQAVKSLVFRDVPVHKIVTSMNHEIFRPVPLAEAKQKLGIPADKTVIFFGAVFLDHRRKGFDYLVEALNIVKTQIPQEMADRLLLLVAGQAFESISGRLPFAFKYLEMLDNGAGVASAYQAADFFVCPSVEDSGPTMINQSVMAGTPVVSFETGVALDLVHDGKTGYRAVLKDSRSLAGCIRKMLLHSDAELAVMKKNCRELAMRVFHPDVNTQNWFNLILNHTQEQTKAVKA